MYSTFRKIEESKVQPFFRPDQFYSKSKKPIRRSYTRNNLAKRFGTEDTGDKRKDNLRLSTPRSQFKPGRFKNHVGSIEQMLGLSKVFKDRSSTTPYNLRDIEASASPSLRSSRSSLRSLRASASSPPRDSPRQSFLSKLSGRRPSSQELHEQYVKDNSALIEDIQRTSEERKVQQQINNLVKTNFSPCLCPGWESLCLHRNEDANSMTSSQETPAKAMRFKPIGYDKGDDDSSILSSTPKDSSHQLKPIASFKSKKSINTQERITKLV